MQDEREQITSNIGNTEVNLSLKLQELDSRNSANLDAALTEIDEKLDERFSSLNGQHHKIKIQDLNLN